MTNPGDITGLDTLLPVTPITGPARPATTTIDPVAHRAMTGSPEVYRS